MGRPTKTLIPMITDVVSLEPKTAMFFHTLKWDYNFLCNIVTWKYFRILNLAFQAQIRSSIDQSKTARLLGTEDR